MNFDQISKLVPTLQQWTQSFKTKIFSDFGVVLKKDKSFVTDYLSGKLIVPPNGFCFLHSLLQVTQWSSHAESSKYAQRIADLHQDLKGISHLPMSQAYQICAQLSLQILTSSEKFNEKRPALLCFVRNGTGHVCAYVPKRMNDAMKPDLKLTSESSKTKTAKCIKNPPQAQKIKKVVKLNSKKPLTDYQKMAMDIVKQNQKVEQLIVNHQLQKDIYKLTKQELQGVHSKIRLCNKPQQYMQLPKHADLDYAVCYQTSLLKIGLAHPNYPLFVQPQSLYQLLCYGQMQKKTYTHLFTLSKEAKLFYRQNIVLGSTLTADIPLVDSVALNHLGMSSIAAIHAAQPSRLQVEVKKSSSKIVLNYDNTSKDWNLEAKPHGPLHRDFITVLNKYGFCVTQKTIEESATSNSGHQHLRFGQDCGAAVVLERMIRDSQKPGKQYTIIFDFGGKFAQISTILNKLKALVSLDHRIIYVPIRPCVNDYDILYYQDNLGNYMSRVDDSLDSISRGFADRVIFLPPIQAYAQDVINENIYDDLARTCYPGISDQQIQNRQDFSRDLHAADISLYMSDVHYYLGGYVPKLHATIYACGGLFHPVPGTYTLPMREGTYVVHPSFSEQPATISMSTQGSGNKYNHPLVHVVNPTSVQSYGWYKHFQLILAIKPTDQSPFENIYVPPFQIPGKSVQAQALDQFYTELSPIGLKVISPEHKFWKEKAFNSDDYLKISKCYNKKKYLLGFYQYNESKLSPTVTKLLQRWTALCGQKCFTSFHLVNNVLNIPYIYKQEDICKNAFFDEEEQKYDFFDKQYIFVKKNQDINNLQNQPQNYQNDVLLGGLDEEEKVCQYFGQSAWNKKKQHVQIAEQLMPAQKIPKYKNTSELDFGQITDYYKCKEFRPQHLLCDKTLNVLAMPAFEGAKESWSDNRQVVARWLVNNPVHASNGKNGMLYDVPSQTKIIPTGMSILLNGTSTIEFEWASKSIQNGLYGFHLRLLGSNTQYDPVELPIFNEMCTRVFDDFGKFMTKYDWKSLEELNSFKWLEQKSEFTKGKKDKYKRTMEAQLSGVQKEFIGSFKTMVKTGEVYSSQNFKYDHLGNLLDQESRPRNVCVPSDNSCGYLTALQSVFWEPIKRFFPGFIQGLSKKQMQKLFQSKVNPSMDSLSMDGSCFESTQFAELQKCVDHKFWESIREPMIKHLNCNEQMKQYNVNVPDFVNNIIKSATRTTQHIFMNINNVQSKPWTKLQIDRWNKDWSQEGKYEGNGASVRQNWVCYSVEGITLSGHPTLTTLGNTLRTLCYQFYYLEKIGIKNPWKKEVQKKFNFWTAAAGDDSLIFICKNLANKLKNKILSLTLKQKSGCSGLGQILKCIFHKDWWDIDFCSKWAFCTTGLVEDWRFYRDCEKALSTKQFFTKDRKEVASCPGIHAQAMLEGLQSEGTSLLLEDFFRYRVYKWSQLSKVPISDKLKMKNYNDRIGHEFSDQSTMYFDQDEINQRLGISLGTLLQTIAHDSLQLGSVELEFVIRQPQVYSVLIELSIFEECCNQDQQPRCQKC